MHRVLMRTVVLDFPADVHDEAISFWQIALSTAARQGTNYPEFRVLEHPASLATVMVQRIGERSARVHLDIETDDRTAEVDRLTHAGAVVVEEHEEWTVLRDPAGLVFCVVPADSEGFEEHGQIVG